MERLEFVRPNNLLQNLVIVDGMSTAGKSLIAPIISSFKRGELWRINYINDYLTTIAAQGKIDPQAASTLLNMMADVDIYNLMIGREVNFRVTDDSGVDKNLLHERYRVRLSMKDGDDVRKTIMETNPILTVMTHYIFGESQALFSAFEKKLKLYIIMLRHPYWLVENWHNGGWNQRIGKDEREFNLCCNVDGKLVPWFAVRYADEYLSLPPLEQAVRVISGFLDGFYERYGQMDAVDRAKVMFIPFEKMATSPWDYLTPIMKTLGTEVTPRTAEVMEKMKVPRKLGKADIEAKRGEFEKLADEKKLAAPSRALMNRLCREYEDTYLKGWL